MNSYTPHPFSDLGVAETTRVRDIILALHKGFVIVFRTIYVLEPLKSEVLPFLEIEHAGKLDNSSLRPSRLAQARYDVIGGSKVPEYHESVINITSGDREEHRVIGAEHHASLTRSVCSVFQTNRHSISSFCVDP